MSHIRRLYQNGKLTCSEQIAFGVCYEALTGSEAYGVTSGESDRDCYAISIPSKRAVTPSQKDYIPEFDIRSPVFTSWLQHHIPDERWKWDIQIFGIAKCFRLMANANPNMIDMLFVPRRCVLYTTGVGEALRDNRKLFLSKKCWQTFKGYAYSQLGYIRGGRGKASPARQATIAEVGYDTKFAYHVVRLLLQVEQLLMEGDLDLERNRETLKAVRRGDWKMEKLVDWIVAKEPELEKLYTSSTALPAVPDEEKIRELLLYCIERTQ